jgi:hypothetical protein
MRGVEPGLLREIRTQHRQSIKPPEQLAIDLPGRHAKYAGLGRSIGVGAQPVLGALCGLLIGAQLALQLLLQALEALRIKRGLPALPNG